MKISLAKSAGFCFGVKRALKIALKTARPGRKVYILGDIVHNEEVVKQMGRAGVKKIKRLSAGKGKILLIRAHGVGSLILRKAVQLGYKIVDATCPMVKEIHKIAQNMERKGYQIIVIGDKNHDEVHGIVGQLKTKALVIDNFKNMPFKKIKKIAKACVVVQSTQNLERVNALVDCLKRYIKNLKFFNTICMPTRIKQQELKRMPKENDVIIIIGSKTSANTKRLYEISKSINKCSFWIQSEREIKRKWFKGVRGVGITAGASTLDSTTRGVIKYIKQLVS